MNLYPYTDFHELNDDWIIEHIKQNETNISAIQNTIVNLNFEFDRKADKATTYTKSEVNTLLSTKANVSDLPDMSNYYTKSETYSDNEVDDLISNIRQLPDSATATPGDVLTHTISGDYWYPLDAYTKTEADNLLSAKADISSLAAVATTGNYNDLNNKPTIPAFSKTTLLDEQMPTSAGLFNYIGGASVDDFDFIALCCAWQSGSNSNCVLYPKGILYNQPIILKLNNDPDGVSYVRIESIGSTNCTAYGSSTNTRLRIYGIKY